MAEKELKVLILGGSGHLGRSIFMRLKKSTNIKVLGTYYENKPKWAGEGEYHYLNGNATDLDSEIVDIAKSSDVILNLMHPRRADFSESVLFDTPLKLAEIAHQSGNRFISLCGSINQHGSESQNSKAIQRLTNVLSERGIGTSIYSTIIIDKDCRLVDIIASLSRYKLTPMVGEGSNRVRAIHTTDFSMVLARLVHVHLPHKRYDLIGSEAMTIRHLFNIVCKEKGGTKPIFLSIKRTFMERYRNVLGDTFGAKVELEDIQTLDFNELVEGDDLCAALKVKPLSFDARVKRDGL